MKRILQYVAVATISTALAAGVCTAAEHPGTPVEQPKAEHPGTAVEKPKAEHPGKAVSARSVKKAIKAHVAAQSKATGGVFVIKDDKLGKEWKLKLAKIHDPVRMFKKDGKTIYFTCSDFKSTEGKDVLDIDFWMVEKNGKLEVTDTKIHKLNGEPRYNYEGTEIKEVK